MRCWIQAVPLDSIGTLLGEIELAGMRMPGHPIWHLMPHHHLLLKSVLLMPRPRSDLA